MPTKPSLPSLAGADWLTATHTRAVFSALAAGGFEARAVGGVVRNTLMGLAVTDIDIATPALPEDVMACARAAGLGVAATGLKHGTVTVIAGHHPIEVTTLRVDTQSHGRHATVAFTTDWHADARRRDFTMNALYCASDGTVHDPLGGYDDLVARQVRFIGEARQRIAEDYLRILRFFRFTAQYADGVPDAAGIAACIAERGGLALLSAERVHQEMMRLMTAKYALGAVRAMQESGILAVVLPAAPRPGVLERLAAIEQSLGRQPDAVMRLGILAVAVEEDALRLAARLRMSGEERQGLRQLAWPESRQSEWPDERAARALLYRNGAEVFSQLIIASWSRCLAASTTERGWVHALALPKRWTAPKFPISGTDVMARGVRAGPEVGNALRRLEEWWIANDFAPDRDALLDRLDQRRPQ